MKRKRFITLGVVVALIGCVAAASGPNNAAADNAVSELLESFQTSSKFTKVEKEQVANGEPIIQNTMTNSFLNGGNIKETTEGIADDMVVYGFAKDSKQAKSVMKSTCESLRKDERFVAWVYEQAGL